VHVHQPREVGARDRLVRPHQVERDARVYLARGAAAGDVEIFLVDLAHDRVCY
jgi:hypothetical protein